MLRSVLLFSLVVAGCGKDEHVAMSAEQRAQLGERLDKVEAYASELEAARKAGIAAALAGPPDAIARECPADVVAVDAAKRPQNIGHVAVAELPSWAGQRLRKAHALAKVTRHVHVDRKSPNAPRFPPTFDELMAEAEPWLGTASFPYDVVYVIQSSREAKATAGNGFTGGELNGTAMVWSYRDGAVACARPIALKLNDVEYVAVGSGESADAQLQDRLLRKVEQAVVDGLQTP